MKQYNYGVIVKNNETLKRESTYLDNDYKPTKYALIEKQVFKDGSEGINRIIYSSDLEQLISLTSIYPSWYNYPGNLKMNMQGYITYIDYTPRKFTFSLAHDKGKAKLTVSALNLDSAMNIVCTMESCPKSAVKLLTIK